MRSLVIANEYPWPENSGSRMRLMTTLLGLSGLGPTELFSIVPSARSDFDPPDRSIVGRVGSAVYDQEGSGLRDALLHPWLPFSLSVRGRPTLAAALHGFTTGEYDLLWFHSVRSWLFSGGPSFAPVVLDLDDLEDQKILGRLSVPRPPEVSVLDRVRGTAARYYSEEEARRWRRLQRRGGRAVERVVVCSRIDAERATEAGLRYVAVVPNGYPSVPGAHGPRGVGSPPVVVFQGTLRYPPNAHAARYLVEEVGPALRALVPGVRIRLVGRTTPALEGLADPPDVTLVGQVPDIGAELAGADLVLVPVRFGSGTRVKIIEAFAHRVPVVSTTLGAEGLGARDEEHLLIGDDAEALARASKRLLTDGELRGRIVERAHALFLEQFERARVEGAVRAVATGALEP
ncbi:MAG: glycosyltransferase family 4 protein [Acidimicrobiales bacterium]